MYSNLQKVVDELTACNDLPCVSVSSLEDCGLGLGLLDVQAGKLPDDKILVFVDGDREEARELATQYGIEALSDFLEDLFNGAY